MDGVDILRKRALALFHHAVNAVNGDAVVRHALGRYNDSGEMSGPVFIAAVGKAAPEMVLGAHAQLGATVTSTLLISDKPALHPQFTSIENLEYIHAGHPFPNDASLQAGERLLAFVSALPAEGVLVLLISGGASALAEVLPEGFSLEQWRALNRWLLESGLDIAAINQVRASVSRVKAGRLIAACTAHRTLSLLISDISSNDPRLIGSGLGAAPWDPRWDALPLPEDWRTSLKENQVPPAAALTTQLTCRVIASNGDALQAAAQFAQHQSWLPCQLHNNPVGGEAQAVGKALAATLRAGPPGVHLWGGETTVKLPAQAGEGGRCQHLALAAATVLAGSDDIVLLAAGSDGRDGPGSNAGAVVDGGTIDRGEASGMNAETALACADAGSFLLQAGDLIDTGPTGTNVADLIIGIKA